MSQAMREERLLTVLLGPHISEKSHLVAESGNQVVFKVAGKVKRRGRGFGRRAAFKKAYVSLAAGSEIDFLGAE